ncbi:MULTISPECIES: molybdenum ABC transporter permease [Marichromatium]|uniref:Molybdate transport system permease protein n=1 Tax=Marichromatium gracile TaxID=1048 RepID=A0A4R4ABD4_MARGR|nr:MULTISPECIES: ABC transporter permease subunit [Marichromatium]MBK1710687.1 molybdate ABC transporter permease subunit [Marichromatium gracile]RNE88457.1 ABC transporter permease subunit [Marichromatium sp. AB31]RNE90717.1 ABC transporter permease subunit [Marichromatium sp. AB32]TCW36321.1 molybdate transport system permease protein [Marichromatium gracile]
MSALLACSPDALLLSLRVVAVTLALLLVAGVGLGYLLSLSFPLRWLLDALVSLPLVFPPIAIGFFLLMLFGRHGVLGAPLHAQLGWELVFSFPALVLAAFIAGLPLVVKPVQSAIEGSARVLVEASYTLGKGRLETLWRVVIPAVRPSLAAGLTLGAGRAFGEVGITLMLGGNLIGSTETLSLAIYNHVLDGDFTCATRLSLLLGGISLVLFLLLRRLGRL